MCNYTGLVSKCSYELPKKIKNVLYKTKKNDVFSGLHSLCANTYPCLPVMGHAVRPVQSAVHEQAGNTSTFMKEIVKVGKF